MNDANTFDELQRRHFLQDQSTRAESYRSEAIIVAAGRQDDRLRVQRFPLHLLEYGQSVLARHSKIENDDVGQVLANRAQRRLSIARCRDNLEIPLA